ncbi:MAG: hypothetical protein ICV73_10230 [Acetobacteraceae bacterium]|nr:hypothetical protein [Acetobacteraceae bacterium]
MRPPFVEFLGGSGEHGGTGRVAAGAGPLPQRRVPEAQVAERGEAGLRGDGCDFYVQAEKLSPALFLTDVSDGSTERPEARVPGARVVADAGRVNTGELYRPLSSTTS